MKHDTWKIWRPHGCRCEMWGEWSACRRGCVPCGDPVDRAPNVLSLLFAALGAWMVIGLIVGWISKGT